VSSITFVSISIYKEIGSNRPALKYTTLQIMANNVLSDVFPWQGLGAILDVMMNPLPISKTIPE